MRAVVLASLVAILAGCGTPQTRSYGEQADATLPENVVVLYSFPGWEYQALGAVNLRYYRPGLTDPTVEQAVPKLQEAGAALGADAVVVIERERGGDRTVRIRGEAIKRR